MKEKLSKKSERNSSVKDSLSHSAKPLKNTPVFVAGLPQSGKTVFICAMIRLAEKYGLKAAGIKPFDKGLIKRNAEEQVGDGELFCKYMSGEPTESLVAPYIANEDYPLEMAFRRDGIKLDFDKIQERMSALDDQYDRIFVELPPSLFAPLNEEIIIHQWFTEFGNTVVWMIHPIQEQFTHNLSEIHFIKSLGLQVHYLLNNATKIMDQDQLFFIWEKLESVTEQTMAGMIPFDSEVNISLDRLVGKVEDSIPVTVENLLNNP